MTSGYQGYANRTTTALSELMKSSLTMDRRSSNNQTEEYLDGLSNHQALVFIPVMLVLVIIMVIGLAGNSLVLYIYLLKFKPSSSRSAILALAVLDLSTCAISIPGEILDLRYAYSFDSEIFCKGFRTLSTTALIASGLTLLAVAVDRYHRICRPMRTHINASQAWWRVFYACGIALALSIPAPIIYGLARAPTPLTGIHGKECSTSQNFEAHLLPIAYNTVLCVLFISSFTTMIALYALIGRQVLRQNQFLNTMPNRRCGSSTRSDHVASNKQCEPDSDPSISDGLKDEVIAELDMPSTMLTAKRSKPGSPTSVMPTPHLFRQESVLSQIKRSWTSDARTRKTTMMLFFITTVFVASFLPHLLLKVIQALDKSFEENLSTAGLVFYNIFVRSYFFNTAFNFFVYGCCSPKFRKEVKKLCIHKFTFWVKRRRTSVQSDDIL